jgi:hypothetical protein
LPNTLHFIVSVATIPVDLIECPFLTVTSTGQRITPLNPIAPTIRLANVFIPPRFSLGGD